MGLEEEIEQCKKRKLRLYEDLADGVITKTEYTDFRNAYNKVIENKTDVVQRMKKEQNQAVASGMGNRAWGQAFSQYQNIEELDRRVLVALVDRILVYDNTIPAGICAATVMPMQTQRLFGRI